MRAAENDMMGLGTSVGFAGASTAMLTPACLVVERDTVVRPPARKDTVELASASIWDRGAGGVRGDPIKCREWVASGGLRAEHSGGWFGRSLRES